MLNRDSRAPLEFTFTSADAIRRSFCLVDKPRTPFWLYERLCLSLLVPFVINFFYPPLAAVIFAIVSIGNLIELPYVRLRIMQYNLSIDYKNFKSRWGIIATLASYAIGVLLACLFANTAFFIALTTFMNQTCHVNLTFIIFAGVTSAYFLENLNMQLKYILGAASFITLNYFIGLPLLLSPAIDAAALIILFAGLIGNLISKYVLAWYTQYQYGASNADGFVFAIQKNRVCPQDKVQADTLHTSDGNVASLRSDLLRLYAAVAEIPKKFRMFNQIEARDFIKNLFFLLMSANAEQTTVCVDVLQNTSALMRSNEIMTTVSGYEVKAPINKDATAETLYASFLTRHQKVMLQIALSLMTLEANKTGVELKEVKCPEVISSLCDSIDQLVDNYAEFTIGGNPC